MSFPHAGFFTGAHLTVAPEAPWSRQLPELAETWMSATPEARLDKETRQAWVTLCTAHAPSLTRVDAQARFGADYPPDFLTGFRESFAAHQPADLPPVGIWAYLGRVLDMFALSDPVTRPLGHPVADQAATQIRRWLTEGVPDTP